MKLTYKELHQLFDLGIKLKVKTPNGLKLIKGKFLKEDTGNHIVYNDNTETKCSVTHHMETTRGFLSSNDLKVGDVLNNKIIVKINKLDNQLWYDFEVDDLSGLYYQNDIIHHNSGKSLVIFLIFMFMRENNARGLMLVPNINLLHQMKSDFSEYLQIEKDKVELKFLKASLVDKKEDQIFEIESRLDRNKIIMENIHIIGGGNTDRHFENSLTISTWQSMQNRFNTKELSDVEPSDYCKDIINKRKLHGKFKKITYLDGTIKIIEYK